MWQRYNYIFPAVIYITLEYIVKVQPVLCQSAEKKNNSEISDFIDGYFFASFFNSFLKTGRAIIL